MAFKQASNFRSDLVRILEGTLSDVRLYCGRERLVALRKLTDDSAFLYPLEKCGVTLLEPLANFNVFPGNALTGILEWIPGPTFDFHVRVYGSGSRGLCGNQTGRRGRMAGHVRDVVVVPVLVGPFRRRLTRSAGNPDLFVIVHKVIEIVGVGNSVESR